MANVRLGNHLENRLAELAELTARSKTFYMKEALQKYLDEYEEELMILHTRDRIKKGLERTYTLEEVEEMLGLKDED